MNWLYTNLFLPTNYVELQIAQGEAYPEAGPGYTPPVPTIIIPWNIYIGA